MAKMLLVDDEDNILTLLSYHVQKQGYEVDTAGDGHTALRLATENTYACILLDLMLPKLDGMEVCRRLRHQNIDTPIIMLTAKSDEVDKILGLELGADDYLTKPFSPRELLARIKAVLRRYQPEANLQLEIEEDQEEILRAGDLRIYLDRHQVYRSDKLLNLTKKEFQLLIYLMKRRGRTLSREVLLDKVWGFDFTGESRIVDVHIGNLRDKIEEDSKTPQFIKTVRGYGYQFSLDDDR